MYRALEKGLSFKTTFGNVLTLTPPLTVTEAEMTRALDIIDEAIASVAAEKLYACGDPTIRAVGGKRMFVPEARRAWRGCCRRKLAVAVI